MIGQYMQPTKMHHPVLMGSSEQFAEYKEIEKN